MEKTNKMTIGDYKKIINELKPLVSSRLKVVKGFNSAIFNGEARFIVGFNSPDDIRTAFIHAMKYCENDKVLKIYVLERDVVDGWSAYNDEFESLEDFREIDDLDMVQFIDKQFVYLSKDALFDDIKVIRDEWKDKTPTDPWVVRALQFSDDYEKCWKEDVTEAQKRSIRKGESYIKVKARNNDGQPWTPFNQTGYLEINRRISKPTRLNQCGYIYGIGFEPKK